jgi:glutamyl/glutaminyl-tRNA synthetase
LGIIPDESLFNPVEGFGPYQQSEKFPHYRELADTLIAQGKAYKCFCTPEELEADFARQEAEGVPSPKYNLKCYGLTEEQVQANIAAGKPYSVRFHVLPNKTYVLNDIVRGEVTFNSNDFGDFIIVKSNHIGTYNFAVVIDDHEMKITHVIRGEEHISNTPRQLMLYEAFG